MSGAGQIKHALIMAAGRGMRMRPMTDTIPKAMAPFRGETLIANGIRMVKKHVSNVHVTVGYMSAMLAEHLMHIGVTSIHNTEGQSNSWWIYHTLLTYVNEPVLVLTCDNVVDLDFALLSRDYYAVGAPACMLVPVRPVAGLDGDFIDHTERCVTRVQRREPREIYCSGIQVINPYAVAQSTTEGSNFYDVWNQLIARRQLYISSVYPKTWFTVDTEEQLAKATNGLVSSGEGLAGS
jgi:NDP-sugar pyrophosphorylase family protein